MPAAVGPTAALVQLNADGKPELVGPNNPLHISGGGGGGGTGEVTSVNGQKGIVVLDAASVGAKEAEWTPTTEDISDASAIGRQVMTAESQAQARAAIGAGTSSLALGSTAETAKPGNWRPAALDISNITSIGADLITSSSAGGVRNLIGAGTSNLALGTTSNTAKPGDWTPPTLSQANAENPSSTSAGLATGQRIAQAVAAYIEANNVLVSDGSVTEVQYLTQSEYDALPTKSNDVEYNILADPA